MSNEISSPQTGKPESQYADLKKELIEIAVILEKYPEALRPKVFDVLLSGYRGKLPALVSPTTAVEEHSSAEPEAGTQGGSGGNRDSKPKKRTIPDTYSIDPDLNL